MMLRKVIILAAFILAGPVQAQDFAGPLSPSVFPSFVGHDPISMAVKSSGRSDPKLEKGSDAQSVTRLDFAPSPELRAKNIARFAQQGGQTTPLPSNIIEKIEEQIRPLGLSTASLADAFALYWMSAWSAANVQENSPTKRQAQAVSRQAAKGLIETPALRSATDSQKQELAEAMLIQAVLIDGYSDLARRDTSLQPKVVAAVRQGAKKMGLNLDAARLTEDGFVPTGKRSEADVAGPAQMAANADVLPAAANDGEEVHPALWALGGAGALAAAYGVGKMIGRKG